MGDEEATSGSRRQRWTRPIVFGERPRTAEDDYEVERGLRARTCSSALVSQWVTSTEIVSRRMENDAGGEINYSEELNNANI